MATKLAAMLAAAGDLNESLGIKPPIPTDGITEDDLEKALKTEAVDILAKDDALSPETWATLEKLGCAEKAIAERKAALGDRWMNGKFKELAAAAPATDAPPPPAAGKGKGKGKNNAKANAGKPKASNKKKSDAPKGKTGPRYTRDMAFAEAVKSGVKDEEKLMAKADAIYVKKTGAAPNPREAKWTHAKAMGILLALELVEVKDGKANFKFIKK